MLAVLTMLALSGKPMEAEEGKMSLEPVAPCGIFMLGEPIAFTSAEGGDTRLSCVVRNYEGEEVWQDRIAGQPLAVPPQPPGYYTLEWRAGEQQGTTSFGVIPARPDKRPPSGPLAVDGATAWLSDETQWEPIARMLRRTGIGWMRERLSWGQVAPEEGKLDWGKYQTVADTLDDQGVRVYQIFHDSPGWTHPGEQTRNPDDLRHVYRFTKEAAGHFRGQIPAWEPWNEPDIGFFDQLGDKYAGIQKAAYLGFKAGNPDVDVLLCSLCRGHSAFSDNIFECGVADYMDVFNFHTYSPVDRYVATIRSWVDLAERYGVGDGPIWLTEAGIRLLHKEGEELTPELERTQAEFVPRSFAISLAGGVDKHFFFVLPFYPERGVQFGAMRKDLSPRPGLVAIATAVRLLGEGRFLGKLLAEPEGCEAYVFHNGKERVAVVWASEDVEARLPVAAESVRVVDLLGRERQAPAQDGHLTLPVSSAAQYVVGLGPGAEDELTGAVREPGRLPRLQPSKVVIVGYLETEAIDKDRNAYIVRADRPVRLAVDAYNFDEELSAQGTIRLELPEGWEADRMEAGVRLRPMDRDGIRFTLSPRVGQAMMQSPVKVWVRGDFPGETVAPSVSYARLDLTSLEPTRRESLGLEQPEAWQPNIPGYGKMEIRPGAEGGVSFPISFEGTGDRWCYPRVDFAEAQDWSRYHALAFEFRFDTDDPRTSARVQVGESGGSSYLSPAQPATKEWTPVIALFGDMSWGSFSAPDPNNALDLEQVDRLLVGCNTKLDGVTLEVRNVELVAFD
jgi:hypothetical protein